MKSMLRSTPGIRLFPCCFDGLGGLGKEKSQKNAGTGGAPKNKQVRSVDFSKISVTNTGNRDGMVGMLLLFV